MKKINLIKFHIFYITFFSMLACTSASYSQETSTRNPSVGDKYTYRKIDMWSSRVILEETEVVTGIQDEYIRLFIETSFKPKGEELIKPQISERTEKKDFSSTIFFRGEKFKITPLVWPLKIGSKWAYHYKYLASQKNSTLSPVVAISKFSAEVVGWENIKTPAGLFKTIKLKYKNTMGPENEDVAAYINTTSWYCPDIRATVKYTSESFSADGTPQAREKTELLSYELK